MYALSVSLSLSPPDEWKRMKRLERMIREVGTKNRVIESDISRVEGRCPLRQQRGSHYQQFQEQPAGESGAGM